MAIQAALRQLPRNIFLAGLIGFACTLIAGFSMRYSRVGLVFLPYGVDDPFAPLANVLRNSFWIGLALVICSLFRDPNRMNYDAIPILFLNIQLFVGEILILAFFAGWHHVRLPYENTSALLLLLTIAGQIFAYGLRLLSRRLLPAK